MTRGFQLADAAFPDHRPEVMEVVILSVPAYTIHRIGPMDRGLKDLVDRTPPFKIEVAAFAMARPIA